MTVLENVMVGALARARNTREARELAMEILEFVGEADKKDILAGSLTIADKKRLEMARALATKPKLLMLDEVMAGLNPAEVSEAVDLILKIQEQGITVFLVEHVMAAIMPISNRIIVLDSGEKIAEGLPEEIASNERVIKAYLGERYRAGG